MIFNNIFKTKFYIIFVKEFKLNNREKRMTQVFCIFCMKKFSNVLDYIKHLEESENCRKNFNLDCIQYEKN